MSKTIADYTPALTIDPVNDYLLIEPQGDTVYKSINRNTLLGLASAPLGLTDSQSPQNKIFDNTNSLTIKDSNFTIQDNADVTKQAQFQLSGITTGTTRTYTLPNASVTLASLSGTETLTNKTITSPTITGGTIDNTTITVDSIAGHTSSTIVTVANLQISNGVLNSANAVTATSIAAGAVQPQALVAGTGSGWGWQTWTPTWTNLGVTGSTVVAKYIQIGKTVFYEIDVIMALGQTPTGAVTFTLPVTAAALPAAAHSNSVVIGNANYVIAAYFPGIVILSNTTTALLQVITTASSYAGETALSATIPDTWGTGGEIFCQGFYQAA